MHDKPDNLELALTEALGGDPPAPERATAGEGPQAALELLRRQYAGDAMALAAIDAAGRTLGQLSAVRRELDQAPVPPVKANWTAAARVHRPVRTAWRLVGSLAALGAAAALILALQDRPDQPAPTPPPDEGQLAVASTPAPATTSPADSGIGTITLPPWPETLWPANDSSISNNERTLSVPAFTWPSLNERTDNDT
jgi:hypothetical protein